MTTWTKIAKASGTVWTKITKPSDRGSGIPGILPGEPIGLLLALTYSETGSIGTQWTKVTKPSGTTWTKIAKPV